MSQAADTGNCRFLSSLGGVHRCQDPSFREGFCRFHFDAFLRGEVLDNGQLNEHLGDQHRRREINYHGLSPEITDPASEPVHR